MEERDKANNGMEEVGSVGTEKVGVGRGGKFIGGDVFRSWVDSERVGKPASQEASGRMMRACRYAASVGCSL